ncbi:hypothetical protein PRZ48_015251 [Zasmidium cellare]|uniref:FMN-dependent dehydrogenase domain-containing protein n=1 Tax=Zasmidium cellare TaxID=395010 RepID=A0ABR0DWK4_ZASCE|nr:hypothetical protein PRZ48_015251 [Zasmidium cellare]
MSHRLPYLDREVLTINDLKAKAGGRIPAATREWLDEGAMDLITLKENEEAYNRYKLRPRTLRNVRELDTSTSIWGTKVPAGFKAMIVSVDIPVLGLRLSEYRNDFTVPKHVKMPMLHAGEDDSATDPDELTLDDSLAWAEAIPWLRANTKMEIWLKGNSLTEFQRA